MPKPLLLALLVLNLGASSFMTFELITRSPQEPAPPAPTLAVTGPIEHLDPFVVNLDEPVARYLRTTLSVELESDEAAESLDQSRHSLHDTILAYLSGLHVEDTLGVRGRDKLRGELLAKISQVVGPHKIRRVLFDEFVVQ
jgi:flagellar protein FliL